MYKRYAMPTALVVVIFTILNRSFKQLSDKLCFILYISSKSV